MMKALTTVSSWQLHTLWKRQKHRITHHQSRHSVQATSIHSSLQTTTCDNNETPLDNWKVHLTHQSVSDCSTWAIQVLRQAQIDEPELSVHNLLIHILQLDWNLGYRALQSQAYQDTRLSVSQAQQLAQCLQRRLQHEPIQYICGKWDFLHHTYDIQPPLLCPRPETEELVLLAWQDCCCSNATHILDVGCGTGCIGIELASRCFVPNNGRSRSVTAIDVDPIAVHVATRNAQRILGSDASSRYQALLQSAQDYLPHQRFDCIVANPPYIPTTERDTLDPNVLLYESPTALFAGDDGMDVIRIIVNQLPHWSTPHATCWMEVHPSHPKLLRALLLQDYPTIAFVSSHKDVFGRERFVKLQMTM